MRKWIFKITLLTVVLGHYATAAAADLPLSSTQNNVETFQLDCPGNPKNTTADMNDCYGHKDEQVISIQIKYEAAARKRLEDEVNNPLYSEPHLHEPLQKTLDAYDAETKAWDKLREIASKATYTNWEGGTIRGVMSSRRDIEIRELRIHDVWENWLLYMDSTPAVLPEPMFIDVN